MGYFQKKGLFFKFRFLKVLLWNLLNAVTLDADAEKNCNLYIYLHCQWLDVYFQNS